MNMSIPDALNIMLERGHDIHAIEIRDSQYFDTGTKIEYMKTVTQFALRHPEIGDDYRNFLKSLELCIAFFTWYNSSIAIDCILCRISKFSCLYV